MSKEFNLIYVDILVLFGLVERPYALDLIEKLMEHTGLLCETASEVVVSA